LAYKKLCEIHQEKEIIRNQTLEIFHKNLRLEKNKSITLELSILKKVESEYFDPEELNYYQAFIAYHSTYYSYSLQYALDYIRYNPSSVRSMMLIIHCQIHLKEYKKAKLNFDEFLTQAKHYLSQKEIYDYDSFFYDIEQNVKPICDNYFLTFESPELSVIPGLKSVICYEKDDEEN
jgi:hypothetical protein